MSETTVCLSNNAQPPALSADINLWCTLKTRRHCGVIVAWFLMDGELPIAHHPQARSMVAGRQAGDSLSPGGFLGRLGAWGCLCDGLRTFWIYRLSVDVICRYSLKTMFNRISNFSLHKFKYASRLEITCVFASVVPLYTQPNRTFMHVQNLQSLTPRLCSKFCNIIHRCLSSCI